jgi:hypothetical protein
MTAGFSLPSRWHGTASPTKALIGSPAGPAREAATARPRRSVAASWDSGTRADAPIPIDPLTCRAARHAKALRLMRHHTITNSRYSTQA